MSENKMTDKTTASIDLAQLDNIEAFVRRAYMANEVYALVPPAKMLDVIQIARRSLTSGAPAEPAPNTELIDLLKAIRPNYGAVGSRDVDVTAERNRIDRAIELLSAGAAAKSEQAGWFEGAEDCDGNELVSVRSDVLEAVAEFMMAPNLTARRINGYMVTREELFARITGRAAPSATAAGAGSAQPRAEGDERAPDCGMCNDSGIVGYPPDQYEDCPDCVKARAAINHGAPVATTASSETDPAHATPLRELVIRLVEERDAIKTENEGLKAQLEFARQKVTTASASTSGGKSDE